MAKKIGLGILAVVALLVGVIALQPASFKIERSATMLAPPAVVYPLVADFHNWNAWSPWDKLDPNMKRTFTGPAAGQGAIYEWLGDDKVGQGRMTITQEKTNEEVSIKLEFIKPFAATNQTTFALRPDGAGTKVTWAMEGQKNFLMKAFGLFVNMDKQIGGDFEKGLAQMKPAAEKAATEKLAAEKGAAEKRVADEKAAAEKAEAEKGAAAEPTKK